MKKLFNIVIALITSFSLFAQKYYPGCSGSTSSVIMFDIKNTNTYNGKKETDIISKFDSLDRITLERFIIDRLNYYRKSIGVKLLTYDATIFPATYHHALYQRLIKQQTHSENIDLPNFTELDINGRFKLLNQNVHYNIGEGLGTQGFQIPGYASSCPNVTYKKLVDQFVSPNIGYITSKAHWNDIMNPKWDAICIYYDFEYLKPVPAEPVYIYANVTLVYTQYK